MNSLPLEVQKFLSLHNLATIATVSEDNDYPYVLPVFYIIDDNSTLYFASHKDSKKIRNILSHPHIGISITDAAILTSLQLHGKAIVSEQNNELFNKILAVANENSGSSFAPIMQLQTGVVQVVTFTIDWYRLASYSDNQPDFIEGALEHKS